MNAGNRSRDLRTNLKWIAEGDGAVTSSAVKHNPWRERAAWMLALAFLCALAFFAAGHYRAPSTGEPVRFSVDPPEKTVFSGPANLTVPVPQFALPRMDAPWCLSRIHPEQIP